LMACGAGPLAATFGLCGTRTVVVVMEEEEEEMVGVLHPALVANAPGWRSTAKDNRQIISKRKRLEETCSKSSAGQGWRCPKMEMIGDGERWKRL